MCSMRKKPVIHDAGIFMAKTGHTTGKRQSVRPSLFICTERATSHVLMSFFPV